MFCQLWASDFEHSGLGEHCDDIDHEDRNGCGGPRSASDYIEIARLFHTVVIWEIHQLDEKHRDEARRFISLIDEFYDRGVKVLFNASVEVAYLYIGSSLSSEFERTRSRIIEMRSDAYLSRPHRA